MKKEPQLVHRKIALLGFRAVGKTSLTNSFVSGTFDETYDPTIENTHHKIVRFRKVNFATDIVDTAGMDEYSRLSRNASVGVDGYILVFSIISRQSFDRIKQINESLLSALGDAVDIPRVLVGSICDLNEQRQVAYSVSQILLHGSHDLLLLNLYVFDRIGCKGTSRFLGCSLFGMLKQNRAECE